MKQAYSCYSEAPWQGVFFWIVDGQLFPAPPVPPSQFRSYRQKTEVLSRGSREALA